MSLFLWIFSILMPLFFSTIPPLPHHCFWFCHRPHRSLDNLGFFFPLQNTSQLGLQPPALWLVSPTSSGRSGNCFFVDTLLSVTEPSLWFTFHTLIPFVNTLFSDPIIPVCLIRCLFGFCCEKVNCGQTVCTCTSAFLKHLFHKSAAPASHGYLPYFFWFSLFSVGESNLCDLQWSGSRWLVLGLTG